MTFPVFVRPDGGVSVVVCAPGVDPTAEAARLLALPDYAGHTLAGQVAIPPTRRWRNCWRVAGGAVVEDMPTARVQRMAEVRTKRDALLAASDALMLKALDIGTVATRNALAAYRQSLRDLPTTAQTNVDAAATPDALATYEPTWPTPPVV